VTTESVYIDAGNNIEGGGEAPFSV